MWRVTCAQLGHFTLNITGSHLSEQVNFHRNPVVTQNGVLANTFWCRWVHVDYRRLPRDSCLLRYDTRAFPHLPHCSQRFQTNTGCVAVVHTLCCRYSSIPAESGMMAAVG